jgi:predicted DsbA family dithiol-disulfide isomerase
MSTVRINVWSDYVCPFCYLEEPVLERLKQEFGDAVEIVWRAFELRPEPEPTLDPKGDYLRDAWAQSVYPMAAHRGMTLRLPPVQPRSRLAHEAVEFARDRGRHAEMNHALFRAFFEDGRDIGSKEVLLEICSEAGLDREELREALESGRHIEHVLSDQQLAHELGISGVPALVIYQTANPAGTATMLSGAQPYELVRATVERVARTSE